MFLFRNRISSNSSQQARAVDVHEALAARLGELAREREILLICRSGRRSAQASGVLLHTGHSPVTNVVGRMQAWARAGLPTGR